MGAAPIVSEILTSAAQVKVLATSRESLRLRGEYILTVEPLQPDAAVALFIERAQTTKHTFTVTETQRPTLLQICRLIDHLPLAIELAAARIRHFTPEHLLKDLSQLQSGLRLDVLTEGSRDMPARQRTLRSTIEWSYRLLNQDEQCLLRAVGVFIDGVEIEQLVQVYSAIWSSEKDALSHVMTLLQSLLNKSLAYVEQVAESAPRYRLLELIREFALATLTAHNVDALELKTLRDAHSNAYADVAGDGFEVLHGIAGQQLADQLQLNYSNLHAALEWSFSHGDRQTGCRLVGGLTKFWGSRPRFLHYAERWTQLARQALSEHMPTKVQANVWMAVSQYSAASPDENVESRKRFLQLYESIGDQNNIALGKCLYGQAMFWDREQKEDGVRLLQESLALAYKVGASSNWLVRLNLQCLGQFAGCMGDLDRAEDYFQESFRQYKQAEDLDGIGESLLFLSEIAIKRRQFEQAIDLAEQALPVSRAFENFYMETWARRLIADIHRQMGQPAQAIAHAQATLKFAREHTTEGFCFSTLITLARALDAAGEYDQALAVFNEALQSLKQAEGVHPARGLPSFVGLAYELKEAILVRLANPTPLVEKGNLAQLRAMLP